jgi:transcriptional regulator with XRE-family HTH domain
MSLHPARALGERIKKWRLEQGLFQRDLAKLVGVDEMVIVNWEKGRTKPTRRNLGRIKIILGGYKDPDHESGSKPESRQFKSRPCQQTFQRVRRFWKCF